MKNLLTLILIAFALNAGAQNCLLVHDYPACDMYSPLQSYENDEVIFNDSVWNCPDNPEISYTFYNNDDSAYIMNISDTSFVDSIWSERVHIFCPKRGYFELSMNVTAIWPDDSCVFSEECSASCTVIGRTQEAQQVADIPFAIDNGVQTGVSEFNSKHFLRVFPTTNPVFYVSKPCTITIFNLAGQVVSSRVADSDFAVQGLNSGVYFYRAVSESGTVEGRFVITAF